MPSDKKRQIRGLVVDFIKRFWLFTFFFIAVDTFEQYLQVYIAQVTGRFADAALYHSTSVSSDVRNLVIALASAIVLIPALNYLSNKVLLVVGSRYDFFVFDRFLRQKLASLKRFDIGDLFYRLYDDPVRFRLDVNQLLNEGLVDVFVFARILWVMFHINTLFTATCLFLSILPIVFPLLVKKKTEELNSQEQAIKGSLKDAERRAVENFAFIKAHTLESRTAGSIVDAYLSYFRSIFKRRSLLSTVTGGLNDVINQGGTIAIYLVGSYLIAAGRLTPGSVVVFVALSSQLQRVMGSAVSLVNVSADLNVSLDRVYEILCHAEKTGSEVPGERCDLTVKELSFRHSDDAPWVFSGLSFDVLQGNKVLITGPNGSGKSTLAKLLTGLYEDYSGVIALNGRVISEYDKDAVRDAVSVVSQEPFLLAGSVRENVALAKTNASYGDIGDVMRAVGLADISDHEVGEGGRLLSGGQIKRVEIARALLRDTPVVILDEPTNNLDISAVDFVRKFLGTSGKTLVIITHDQALKDFCIEREFKQIVMG